MLFILKTGVLNKNLKTVKHWFEEWNTRGKVIIWDIKQFFIITEN